MTSRPATPPAPARPQSTPLAPPPTVVAGAAKFVPPPISRREDTGLSQVYLEELALKIIYNSGELTGFRMAELISLPFTGIMDQILESLKQKKMVEVKGAGGFGEGAYQYAITSAGIARAREAMDRSQYAGPAPVPIQVYNDAIRRQSAGRPTVHQRTMRTALANLVISEKTFARIGPAANSGTS